jgi:hypothetical protein
MKQKIILVMVISFFSLVPVAFAENVQVVGRVDNSATNTTGSKVVFEDSTSQNIVSTTTVDPAGIYTTSIPEGTYDITVDPPAGSPLKPVTKTNQKIASDTQVNFTLPSSQKPLESFMQSIPQNVLYAAAGGLILVLLIAIGFFVERKR